MSAAAKMLAEVQLSRYRPITSQNGRLVNVATSADRTGNGSGWSSEGRSRVTPKTMRGGTMAASPRPMPTTL